MDGSRTASVVQNLLTNPRLKLSQAARADLEGGKVDARLIHVLWVLAGKHSLEVGIIKTGHPLGPRSRAGKENSHYYYRALDILAVDDKPVSSNPADPDIVDVGRILRELAPGERPDRIYGPAEWYAALNYPAAEGFISDAFHNRIHADHLHIGFAAGGAWS
jgi:hypothetical protein